MLKSLVGLVVAVSLPTGTLAQVNESPAESSSGSRGPRAPMQVDRGYMNSQGEFNLSLSAGFSSSTMKTENTFLVESEYTTTSTQLNVGLSYGILNDLNVMVGVGYQPTYIFKDNATQDEEKSKGMKEPTIGLAYRLLHQSETMPFDMLLGFAYSPKGEVNKDATTTDDGNVARGADTKTLVLGFYRRVSTGEFGLKLTHAATGEAESEDATDGDKSETDASGITVLSGTAQFEVNEKVHIMAGAGLARSAESKKKDLSSGVTTTTEAYVVPMFEGGLRIIAVPNKAFVDLGIQATAAQDVEIKSSTGTTGKIKTLSSASFSAGLQFFF